MRRSAICGLTVLWALASGCSGQETQETSYFALFIQSAKTGHVVGTRHVEKDKVTTTQTTHMTLNRMGVPMTITFSETSVETRDGKPLSFKSVQDIGMGAPTVTEGVVDSHGKLTIKSTSGGKTTEKTLDWPHGALLPEGARIAQVKHGLKDGTQYTLRLFEVSSAGAVDTKVTVGEKKDVDLLGRIAPLTEVKGVVNIGGSDFVQTFYVNDTFEPLKSTVPMLGTRFELIACTRSVALAADNPVDLVRNVMIKSPVPLKNLGAAKAVTYRLRAKGDAKIGAPVTDDQQVKAGPDGSLTVTVRPIRPAAKQAFPYTGDNLDAREAMKPSSYVESDDKKVVALARKAVGDAKDAATAAKRIEAFVHRYIIKKDLSVGYASAAEVAEAKQGDCTEHAVLAAALCRAVGIPAQVVVGMAYVDDGDKHVFGPHAWFRVFIDGKWVGYDAALPGAYDAGHIALAHGSGDPEAFMGMIATVGNFTVEEASVEK